MDDEDVQLAAHWAVTRISARRPEESLAAIRKLTAEADAYPKPNRFELFMRLALALVHSEGAKGQELAWSLLSRHAALLPKRARADMREAFRDIQMDRITPGGGEDPELTVYELCNLEYGDEEEDEDEEGDGSPFDD